MGEFTQLEKELLPVFSEMERIKESHGGKGSFMGKREYKHTRAVGHNFVQIK